MCENGWPIPQQGTAFIDFGITGTVREETGSPFCFGNGFDQMGMHAAGIFLCQGSEPVQKRAGAGGGKTRDENRPDGKKYDAITFRLDL